MCVVIMFIELNLLVSFLYSNFPSFLLITNSSEFRTSNFFFFSFSFFFPQKEDLTKLDEKDISVWTWPRDSISLESVIK